MARGNDCYPLIRPLPPGESWRWILCGKVGFSLSFFFGMCVCAGDVTRGFRPTYLGEAFLGGM